jgi:uncharacterized membrane protein
MRSARERLFQSLAYEAGGLALSIPAYHLFSGNSAHDSSVLLLTLSVAVLMWAPVHNTIFDWIDFRLSGRLASDRPHRWRIVHAISHEATTLVVTLPILIWLGGLSFWAAVLVDLGLTLLYAVYAYVFHLVYDRLRPMSADLAGASYHD